MKFQIFFKLMNNNIKKLIEKMMNDLEEYNEKETYEVINFFP